MFNRISQQDKLFFTKHLSIMIKSGITLAEALESLADQTESKGLQAVLTGMEDDIKNGQSFYKALSKYPKVFDSLYLNVIKIGEESGTLDESLAFLSIQLAKSFSLQKKIQSALLYPGFVFAAALIVGSFIALYILPQLVDFFAAFNTELPLATRILLGTAEFMKLYGFVTFTALGVLLIGLRLLILVPRVKVHWHAIVLKVPLFGRLLRNHEMARFSRNLGTLIKSGVPILLALDTVYNTLENEQCKLAVAYVSGQVKKGQNLSGSMQKDTHHVFDRLMNKMIGVGEKTGTLDESLLYLSDFYEEEIDTFAHDLTTVLEPVLLIVIGLVVGFIALAIISPIYELTSNLQ